MKRRIRAFSKGFMGVFESWRIVVVGLLGVIGLVAGGFLALNKLWLPRGEFAVHAQSVDKDFVLVGQEVAGTRELILQDRLGQRQDQRFRIENEGVSRPLTRLERERLDQLNREIEQIRHAIDLLEKKTTPR